jgi:hypothetical protein
MVLINKEGFMKSPLETYKEIAKEFNVTEEKSLHIRQKIAFFSEQANQIRMVVNRLIGDLAKARIDLSGVKDDVAKTAYQKEVTKYEDDLRQMTRTLDFFIQLEKELSEENPTISTSTADIPESD